METPGRLDRIRRTLELSDDEFAKVADVEGIVDLVAALEQQFRVDRLPAIVRGLLPGLDGKTILDVVELQGVESVYAILERLRAYIPK
jgi:hypothetical protein